MATSPGEVFERSLYRVERYFWQNRRGQKLCVYTYRCQNPVAAVFFHHGFCEYCGWWKRMFTVLAEAGIDVYAYDMHGHGLSEPQHEEGRVCIVSADHLVEDAEDFLDGIVEPALRRSNGEAGPAAAAAVAPPGGCDSRGDAAADVAADGDGGCCGEEETAEAAAQMAAAAAAEVAADVGEAAGDAVRVLSDGARRVAEVVPRLSTSGEAPAAVTESVGEGEEGDASGNLESGSQGGGDGGAAAPRAGRRVKLFGVAHSLGGGVLSLLEAKRPGTFAGLALNAPALGRKLSFLDNVAMVIVGALRSLCPTAQLIPSTPWPLLSDDEEVPRRADGDAAYFNGACRIVTAYSIATLFQRLNAAVGTVRCPLYVQWASDENITCRAAAESFIAAMSDHEVTWDEIRDARHVMIHGRRGPGLVRAIRDWLLQKVLETGSPAPVELPADSSEIGLEAGGACWAAAPGSGELGGSGPVGMGQPAVAAGEGKVLGPVPGGLALEGRAQLLTVESAACTSDGSDSRGSSGRVPSVSLPADLTAEPAVAV